MMSRTLESPEVLCDANNTYRINHPAFGQIVVSRASHNGPTGLYGSNIGHYNTIEVSIYTSEATRRGVHDFRCPGNRIVSFSMSEAQWGQFVSSMGQGEGTPITLASRPRNLDQMRVPGLPVETIRDKQDNAIMKAADRAKRSLEKTTEKLKALIASGRAGKRELEDLMSELIPATQTFVSDSVHVQEALNEEMEKTMAQAKSEIEAFTKAAAQREGLRQIVGEDDVVDVPMVEFQG